MQPALDHRGGRADGARLLTETDIPRRVLAAQAVLTQVVSLALIARGDRRGVLQHLALLVGAIGAVMFAWSWLDPHASSTLLNGLVMTAVALAVVGTFYGLGLTKLLRDSERLADARAAMVPWLAGARLAAVVAVLAVRSWNSRERAKSDGLAGDHGGRR